MKKRILIADDEAALLKTMAFTLKRKGYETVTFENGRNAYNAIIETFKRGELFDLIITDIQMPGLSGLELIKKTREEGINTPILGITGFGNKQMVIDLMQAGCSDYLDKPFSMNEYIDRISAILEQKLIKTWL